MDQRNFYRYDGVLNRMELGEYKVQGIDYAYTLQGWTKGVNSGTLKASRDMGNDGALSSTDSYNKLHRWMGQDAYGYTLHYNLADYQSVQSFSTEQQYFSKLPDDFNLFIGAFASGNSIAGLYNGNITAMQTALTGVGGEKLDLNLKGYYYDQLMRLKEAQTATASGDNGAVFSSNDWFDETNATDDYLSTYSYDRNGNITNLLRHGYAATGQALEMDQLTYRYAANSFGRVHNKLGHVDDAIAATNYSKDIDDQFETNYLYDRIGNLIRDLSEEIEDIEWK